MRRFTATFVIALASLGLVLTACGGSASTETAGGGAVAADLPTEPPRDKDNKTYHWYENNPQTLRATSGAMIEGQTQEIAIRWDGVKGMIKNQSSHDVLVETSRLRAAAPGKAILKPGDELPYMLYTAGRLSFTKMEGGQAVPGTTSQLWIKDPIMGYPETEFTPPGKSDPANTRDGWSEGTTHEENWGSTRIKVKRETDGWEITPSERYYELYGNPNSWGNEEYAVFTITIDSL